MKTKPPTKTELRTKYAEFLERERALIAPRLTDPKMLDAYNTAIDTLKRNNLFPPPSKVGIYLHENLAVQFAISEMPASADRNLAIESFRICRFEDNSGKLFHDRRRRLYLEDTDIDRFFTA
jgi:hypothetical protein